MWPHENARKLLRLDCPGKFEISRTRFVPYGSTLLRDSCTSRTSSAGLNHFKWDRGAAWPGAACKGADSSGLDDVVRRGPGCLAHDWRVSIVRVARITVPAMTDLCKVKTTGSAGPAVLQLGIGCVFEASSFDARTNAIRTYPQNFVEGSDLAKRER